MKLYQIDAFAEQVFQGNPAAVVPLEKWLSDQLLQNIAQENNLSETAFYVKTGDRYRIRWFTPLYEVDLCGHATLASAWVIFHEDEPTAEQIVFDSNSGELKVSRSGEMLTLDFPAQQTAPVSAHQYLLEGLGVMPLEVRAVEGEDYMIVLQDQECVEEAEPDFTKLSSLPGRGVITTAQSSEQGVDFVSRAFYPKYGIREDPVTGSSHTKLIPYWAKRLKKNTLVAKQLSKRGGTLWCELDGERVSISGKAVKYLEGHLTNIVL